MIWQETARAKLNVTLRVLGRRADGYHLLESLVVFADLGDELSWQSDDRVQALHLRVDGPQASGLRELRLEENLVWRAAQAFCARFGCSVNGALRLSKHLPVSSGMGGGSADAAACLRLLAKAYRTLEAPLDLALGLGADVPVCLKSQAAHMSGIGERVRLMPPPPPLPILLVHPAVSLSTPAVFQTYTTSGSDFSTALPALDAWPCDAQGFARLMTAGGNDLTAAAQSLEPAVGLALSELSRLPNVAGAAMSGSGAACFAVFERMQDCVNAAKQLRLRQSGWWVMPTKLTG